MRVRLTIGFVVVLLAGACSSAAVSTSTSPSTSAPAVTSTSTSTSTPIPVLESTSATTTTVLEVDGVPGDLLALIGAPMPEVDLTIESEDDVERWLSEWIRWRIWLEANPADGIGAVGVGAVPGGGFHTEKVDGLNRQIEAGKAFLAYPESISALEVDSSAIGIGSLVIRFDANSDGAIVVFFESLEISSVIPALGSPVSGEVVLAGTLGGAFRVVSWTWTP